MEGIPLALDAERSPMLELLVIGNLECIFIIELTVYNEEYSIFPGQDEARRTKLVKNNHIAIPNILQQQKINEASVHRSDTDAVTTTEAPPVPVKRVGRGGGAHCPCFFLVALEK